MKKINLVIACLTIVVSTFTAQSVCKASPIAVFNIGGSGMGVWCSCNGQKASIQYSGSAAPGAWIVEEGDCEGDGPCPWHYFGSVGYGGVWEVEAGKCFTGSLDFTLTTTSTDVGNCEPSSPTSKCVGKNVPYTFKATPNGTFSSCPKALIQGVEIR